jgi:hypothetical protein
VAQSRKHSLIESVTNTAIGFAIALTSQILIYPLFNIHITFRTNFWLTVVFTFISIVRGYVLRRIFTKHTETGNGRAALCKP